MREAAFLRPRGRTEPWPRTHPAGLSPAVEVKDPQSQSEVGLHGERAPRARDGTASPATAAAGTGAGGRRRLPGRCAQVVGPAPVRPGRPRPPSPRRSGPGPGSDSAGNRPAPRGPRATGCTPTRKGDLPRNQALPAGEGRARRPCRGKTRGGFGGPGRRTRGPPRSSPFLFAEASAPAPAARAPSPAPRPAHQQQEQS